MIITAAVFYLLIIIISFVLTKDKYNIFLLSNIIFLTTTFLFPFLGTLFGIDVIMTVEGMTLYIINFFVFFVAYIVGRRSVKTLPGVSVLQKPDKSLYAYLVLYIALAVNIVFVAYSVASYGIQGAFINSREVYTTTRTGSGQIYYVAGIFLNIYAITGLFLFRRKALHFLVCVIFALPYGTKGKIFLLLMYNLTYMFFASPNKAKYRQPKYLIILLITMPVVMLGAFWYTSVGLDQFEVLKFAIAYGNEYENNFHDMVKNFNVYFPHGYLHGQILFGDSFYPFMPRVLWPGKPEIFGDLFLSYTIYPEATLGNTGAPSFGPLGQPYADFGFWGSIVQILIEQSILGFILGMIEIKCKNRPTILNFFLLITFSFGGLIALASTNRIILGIINVIITVALFYPLKYNIVWVKRKLQPDVSGSSGAE